MTQKALFSFVEEYIPVALSPWACLSEVIFEYENPTPAGESKNNKFASVFAIEKTFMSTQFSKFI